MPSIGSSSIDPSKHLKSFLEGCPTNAMQIISFRLIIAAIWTVASLGASQGLQARAGAAGATFPPGVTMVEVPFHLVRNAIVVPVRINGAGPFQFVLDTGAGSALLDDPEAAATVSWTIAGHTTVMGAGAGASHRLRLATDVTYDLGGIVLPPARLAIPEAGGQRLMPGSEWQGVFGHHVFSHLVVEIDWRRERLRLHQPDQYTTPPDAQAVPLRRRGGHIFVPASLRTAEPSTIDAEAQVELVVDTGANHALALTPSPRLLPARRIADTVLGFGLNGPIRGALGRIRSLRLAGFTLSNVLTSFPTPALARTIAMGSDGNLGAEILRRFETTFDYSRQRLLLRATDALAEPFAASTCGIYLRPWLNDDGTASVVDIVAHSPSAEAGIEVGDLILAVDGVLVSTLGLQGVREHFEGRPGTRLDVTTRRGDVTRTVSMTLTDLL